jgi:TonB family protein
VKNAPYSAEEHSTLGGNEAPSSKFFRDSQGRVRTESILPPGTAGESRLLVTLTDAADGRRCYLNKEEKVAHCFTALRVEPAPEPNLAVKDLGSKMIEELRVEGKAYIRPAMTVNGNAVAGTTTERWTSPELQIELENREYTDLGSPIASMTTTNIQRGEQPSNLFEIPAGFRTVNETGIRAVIFEGAPAPTIPGGAYRPGNGVSTPRLITKVSPTYTEEARRNKIQGTVTLNIIVTEEGIATNIRVVKSLDPGLDQKAIEAVGGWRFAPGLKDGKPVRVIANVEVNFRLLGKTPSN